MKYLISPFQDYCDEIDEKHPDWGEINYLVFIKQLYNERPFFITNLVEQDIKYRSENHLNVVASIEGQQGCGKSTFGLALAFMISKYFNVPFSMKNIYSTVWELDAALRNSPYASTHILDEQRKKNVGLMSETDILSLIDYEEQCRYTQKNLIYISPEVADHSHYFVFSYDFLTRQGNNACDNDKKNPFECSKGFNIAACYKNKWKTSCKMPFFERKGYPKQLRFILKTHRKIDGVLVPRGYVELPVVNSRTMQLYDSIKKKMVQKLESQEDRSFDRLKKIADDFWKAHGKKTVVKVKKVKKRKTKLKDARGKTKLVPITSTEEFYKSISNNMIESMVFTFLGSMQRFPTKAIKLIVAMVKQKADIAAQAKNESLK